MYSKIEITGVIETKTGMHIGASDGFAAIGAIDSPVAKDAVSDLPYIPGSTLKGKIRSLLAKACNENPVINRDEDHERITRLFGTSKSVKDGYPKPSRLIFSDAVMSNEAELISMGALSATEAKEENSIDPLTAIANPRQIERVIRGAKFPLNIIYNMDNESEFEEDMETLALGLKLLQYDYLGGHGSRGYGKVAISIESMDRVTGDIDEELLSRGLRIIEGK